ncbi:hypothetical protein [Marinobacter sp. VGCF2001]|uniref:hypothetical protein n=1 Tax=Marinobacter sp. VGCF2001 TaxID=3417189 RepID=UPI003CEF8156
MVATEAERQFYLAASGIRMWYARESLPGAAPSPDFDFGDEKTSESVPEPVSAGFARAPAPKPVTADRGRQQIAQLQSLMDDGAGSQEQPKDAGTVPEKVTRAADVAPGEDSAAGATAEPAAATADTQPKEVHRICVTAWESNRVMLVCDVEEDVSFALQDTLARNIMRSIGETDIVQREVVRWPLFNNLKISLNSEHELQSVLQGCFSTADAERTVITLGFPEKSRQRVFRAGLGSSPSLAFPGTLALLASDPALKRQLWQALREYART